MEWRWCFGIAQSPPTQCALEVSAALQNHGRLPVRMGIHSGPVNEVHDVNNRINLAGAGINIAQRVMDCGDSGHILLSRHVAEDFGTLPALAIISARARRLRSKTRCTHRHRQSVRRRHRKSASPKEVPGNQKISGANAPDCNCECLATAYWNRRRVCHCLKEIGNIDVSCSGKSIAVLPFENLSRDPDNAYFADGIQDEILTRLSKIADLKVISRTSTQTLQKCAGKPVRDRQAAWRRPRSRRERAKSGDAVRVNVQLIRAANDSHLGPRPLIGN